MKKLLGALCVLGAMALTGCAGNSAAEPSATPVAGESPNAAACADFAGVVSSIPDVINSDENGVDAWEGLRASFDEVALSADGVVQDRMLTLVDEWPEALDIVVWKEFDEINGHFEDVDRACEADGVEVDMPTLTAG